MKPQRLIFIIATIFLGAAIRLFFSAHSYPKIIFDANTYVDYAKEFLNGFLASDPRTKNMGYPLFLAIIFWLRGGIDSSLVKYTQILLDLGAGLFVWIAASKIFDKKTADLSLLLYMINPFTSSYVGILLPESLSSFWVGLLLVLVSRDNFRRNILLWFLSGGVFGLLVFTKASLLFFALGSIAITSLLCIAKKSIVNFCLITLVGFLVASSYTLGTNYLKYGKLAFTPPYSTIGGQTYVMMFFGNRYPEVANWGVAPELTQMFFEYGTTPNDQISNWNKHYFSLILPKLINEPLTFVSHFAKNLFWLWDKDHLSIYQDPWYPADRYVLRLVNLIFLGLGAIGILIYLRRSEHILHKPVLVITLVMIAVMSLWFPFVSNESRHTIPFYPLLYFWAANGLSSQVHL